jgi:zinc/manganese transport system ATP-binding protein
VLDSVGALEYADRPIGLLSGGEQQRVRIAQALVSDPKLLLCDEPLLSLDLNSQRTISGLVDQRRRTHDTAVVFVTHDINPVLPYVDRVLYLAGGHFRIGTVDEVMTSSMLSELYQSPVEVIHSGGRVLVAGVPDWSDAHHAPALRAG